MIGSCRQGMKTFYFEFWSLVFLSLDCSSLSVTCHWTLPRIDKQPFSGLGRWQRHSLCWWRIMSYVPSLPCVCSISCWTERDLCHHGIISLASCLFFWLREYDQENINSVVMTLLSQEGWLKIRCHDGCTRVRSTSPKIYWGFLGESKLLFCICFLGGWRRKKIRSSRLLRKMTQITGIQKVTDDELKTESWLKKKEMMMIMMVAEVNIQCILAVMLCS